MFVQTFFRRSSPLILLEMGLHQCHHKLGVVPGTNTFRIKLSRVKCLEQTAVSFESCRGSARFEFIKSTHLFLLFFASGRSSSKNGILWSAIHFSLSGLLLQVGKIHRKGILMVFFRLCVFNVYTPSRWMNGLCMAVNRFFPTMTSKPTRPRRLDILSIRGNESKDIT